MPNKDQTANTPRISQLIAELNKILAREGDIHTSCDGFFGECAGVKLHVKHRTKTGHFWNPHVYPEAERGDKVLQITHL